MRETHALIGELVDVRRVVRGASIGREALDAEIVGEDHDNIGWRCRFGGGGNCEGGSDADQRQDQTGITGVHGCFQLMTRRGAERKVNFVGSSMSVEQPNEVMVFLTAAVTKVMP